MCDMHMILKVRPTSDAAYTGVEAVLNHQNYWVDMQVCVYVHMYIHVCLCVCVYI